MRILITGSNGYIGNALVSALIPYNHDLFCVDSGARHEWVKSVGGISLTHYPSNRFFLSELTLYEETRRILLWHQPELIIHLASQPSGPFSELDHKHRVFTQQNNVTILEHLLNASNDLSLSPRFIVTTTTGIPGAPGEPIVEGYTQNSAGSEYHMTRGWDSDNLRLAVRQWKINVLELRTSIVYGTRVYNLDFPVTRFDWDFCFGTVLHRFLLMKKLGRPVMVYGKGEQKKPFISLRDTVQSLVNAVDCKFMGHEIMNQTAECISILDIAKKIGAEIKHIENPRIEKEDHQMIIHNEKFMRLLNKQPFDMSEDADLTFTDIDTSLLPEHWERAYHGK